jgi:hypothetical protein
MRLLLPISLLLLLAQSACKKELLDDNLADATIETCDTTYVDLFSDDTVTSSPYLAAYPGSWWNFSDGSTKACNYWGPVVFTSNQVAEGNCITVYRDRKYLPHISQWGYIYNQSAYNLTLAYQTSQFTKIMDTVPGQIHSAFAYNIPANDPFSNHYHSLQILVIGHLDQLEVNGTIYYDIMHIRHHYTMEHKHYHSIYESIYDYFYAREIGQIRRIRQNSSMPNPDTLDLVDYYIAPH